MSWSVVRDMTDSCGISANTVLCMCVFVCCVCILNGGERERGRGREREGEREREGGKEVGRLSNFVLYYSLAFGTMFR